MSTSHRWTRLVLTGALLLTLPWRHAAADDTPAVPMTVALGDGSTLWLEGTSTLHDFESRTSQIVLTLTADAVAARPADLAALTAAVRGAQVHGVAVTVPVRTLRSGKDGLDKNLWKDLQADAHPEIAFHLTSYTVKTPETGDTLAIHAEGTLEVAGHARPIQLEARAWRGKSGLWLAGSEPLLMSDFGIHPPTMMLGTLKVADRITVHYQLLLAPKTDAAGAVPGAGKEGDKR